MKKIIATSLCSAFVLFLSASGWALDPMAPASMRKSGMIYVQTPSPAKDKIILTNLKTGSSESIKPAKLEVVPAGTYQVRTQMKEYTYIQTAKVTPAERTDVTPGFGKLKVKGPRSAIVQVFDKKQGNMVAQFPANQTQILPRGPYDIKVLFKGMEAFKPNILVVSNSTSELKIKS